MTTTNRSARNTRGQFARKATHVDVVDANTKTSASAESEYLNQKYAQFREILEDMVVPYPLWGAVTNIAVSAFGVYGAIQVATWLGVGALLFTGSTFIAMTIALLAAFVLCLDALRIGSICARYVATGKFESDYQRSKAWLSDKFSSWMPSKGEAHA